MNTILMKIDKVISIILSTLISILAIGVISGVFLRYFLGISYGWIEEFLTMLFICTTFLGSALCVREKQHIGITYAVDLLQGMSKTLSSIFIQCIIIVVSSFIFIYSIRWIIAVGSTLSPSSHIPMGYFYCIVPISSFLTIFYSIVNIAGNFIHIDEAETGYFSDDILPEEMTQ